MTDTKLQIQEMKNSKQDKLKEQKQNQKTPKPMHYFQTIGNQR